MGPKLYEGEHVQRYVDDNFYAFTRGENGEVNGVCIVSSPLIMMILLSENLQVFVATTNIGAGKSLCRSIISPNPYRPGTGIIACVRSKLNP